jgi:SOS-response transcriptional repressor LexA
MADIQTSVVISAQIDGLRSGMEAASNSVQAATDAMRTQLAGLGDIAQQAQSQLNAATGQIGTGIGALQTKAADLAGSISAGMTPSSGLGDAYGLVQPSPASGNGDDVAADEKLWGEELLAYQKFQSDKGKLDLQAVQTSQRTWQSLMQPIQRAFDTSITGMILGTTTLQKAVANIAQSILAEFVNLGVKMVTNWIASELAMTTATEAGAAARTAADGEGMSAGLAIKAANALKSIATDSAQAFSGIFAFLAPIMGPAAAGPAAAGEATVMAAAGGIASAAGGWMVPSDQLAMVHQNEMILPANISQGLQNMISANGSAGSGAVVVNVSAIDSQDVKRFFQSNGSLLVNALNKAMRNGSTLRSA